MTEKDNEIIAHLSNIVDQILSGYCVTDDNFDAITQSENQAVNELSEKLINLAWQYRDSYRFIIDLSHGKLNMDTPRHNAFANPYKQLHSELRHLTWQIQQIADGDYDQRVSFSGDFSKSINKMIHALRERQALTDIVQENEQLFRSIFKTSPDGMLICDLNNNILNMSDSAKEMLQLTDEDLKGEIKFTDLIVDEDKETGKWYFEQLLSENRQMTSTEVRLKRKDGSLFWNEQNADIFNDSKGAPKGIIIVFRDITRRKIDEEQIIRYTTDLKESNLTKDKLFSIIAHDLKNPFMALLGFSDILVNEINSGDIERIEEYAKIINDSATRGYELLVNLLEWSRLQSGRIVVTNEPLSLFEIINNNINISKTNALSKNITIKYLEATDYIINTDKAILNTILRNLISNAIKYTPNFGEVVISTNQTNDFYIISITDSGIGMTNEDVNKLFRTDVTHSTPGTNNEKGTGLGLILCKDFVKKIGGDIWVESDYGRGATFRFTLPK